MREAGAVPLKAPGPSGAFRSQTLAQLAVSFLPQMGFPFYGEGHGTNELLNCPRICSSILVEVLRLGLG